MKYWKTALAILALWTSLALAEDFKTINGKEYKNAKISRVEPDGIVLTTNSGISKVYFTELPKDVQERFHYVDPAERAAAEIEERTRRERDAEAILTEAEEQFETEEGRAAYKYRGDPKGELSGQIFVATRAGQNFKLGAVPVSLFARDAIDALVAGLTAYAHATIGQLNNSVPFYFGYLHSPIQTVETDGEGKFMIPVPRKGVFVIAAHAERTVGNDTETYYWLQPVSLHGQQQTVQNLSNNNLTKSIQ